MARIKTMSRYQRWKQDHLRQQEGLCAICGKRIKVLPRKYQVGNVTLDHIIPISKGGADSYDNTQAVHSECNEHKADT
jgi:5-methylcytosine-specific restriction endonuclease McrA